MTRAAGLCLVMLLALPWSPHAQSRAAADRIAAIEGAQSAPGTNGLGALTIDQLMARFNVPGVSIAVIHDFEIHWAKGYGIADVETGAAVDAETMFQAASISKPVAAMAVLRAVQDGLFTLDDDVNAILTSWKLDGGEFTKVQPVTPRMLTSHTSGLGDGFGFPGYDPSAPRPTVVQILGGHPTSNVGPIFMERLPMTLFEYSGGGVTLMQQALSDARKRPFAEIMRDDVLVPIGMARSSFEQPISAEHDRNAARAHSRDGKSRGAKWHVYPEQAAAGLWTTPSDLARFAIEVQRSAAGKSDRVLSRATVQEMLSPVGVGDYAVGFSMQKMGQGWYFQHGGSNWGFQAMLLAHKVKGYGLAIMTNADSGSAVIGELSRRIQAAYEWDSLAKPAPRGYRPPDRGNTSFEAEIGAEAEAGAAQNRGNPSPRLDGQSIDEMIAAYMAEHDVPGMALAIVQAPYVTRATGYGVSDARLRTLASVNTIFDIAGMKHAYTAVAAMQLVEQGKLQLAVALPLIRDAAKHASLEDAVAKASGQTLQAFVRAGQFDRIGLKHTYFGSELPSVAREALADGARHQRFLHEPVFINPTEPAVAVSDATAVNPRAIYSSASDISAWDIALAGDILIKDASLRRLLYEPPADNGARVPSSGPWSFPGRPGLMVATGSGDGSSSLLSRFTHRDELLCVTLLANRGGLDLTQLARRIAGAYDPKLGPPAEAAGKRFQQSPYSVEQTQARFERALRAQGIATDPGTFRVIDRDGQVWIVVDASPSAETRARIDRALLEAIRP